MSKEEAKIKTRNQNPNLDASPNPNNQNKIPVSKGKSCRGCLYYSSALKSKSQNPTCVGIPRTLPRVPRYRIGKSELKVSKEGRTLTDFKYACVGHSVYLDKKDSSADNNQSYKSAELPLCSGLEVLMDRSAASNNHVPANIHKNKDNHALPQPQTQRSSTGDEFYNRFKRNAGIVATGVVKNVNKIGNRIKETLDDIMYRRPK